MSNQIYSAETQPNHYLGFLAPRVGLTKGNIDKFWAEIPEFQEEMNPFIVKGLDISGLDAFYAMQKVYKLYYDEQSSRNIKVCKMMRKHLRRTAEHLFKDREVWKYMPEGVELQK